MSKTMDLQGQIAPNAGKETEDDLLNTVPPPRRVMPLIYVIDTSGSMAGNKIGAVNDAIRNVMSDVATISNNNADAQIKVAVLQFATDVNWMYSGLTDAESFQYKDLEAKGMTNFGKACKELNDKLSKSHGYMSEPTGMRAPAIILMSDGEPSHDYKHELEKLKGNPWFKCSTKIALAIGDDTADKQMLLDFTGSREGIVTANNVQELVGLITTISLTASRVNSSSASVGTHRTPSGEEMPIAPQQEAERAIQSEINNDPTLVDVHVGPETTGKESFWGGSANW